MECFPQNLNIISQILDFSIEVNWSSFPYLGILISLKDLRFYDWQPALDRIKGKITSQGLRWLKLQGTRALFKLSSHLSSFIHVQSQQHQQLFYNKLVRAFYGKASEQNPRKKNRFKSKVLLLPLRGTKNQRPTKNESVLGSQNSLESNLQSLLGERKSLLKDTIILLIGKMH